MKVIILTEGSRDIGFGHVTRCVSLYQAFQERGIEPFLVINGDDSIKGLVEGLNYEITNWLEKDKLKIIEGCDVVIIDSYLAGKEIYEYVSEHVKAPVYIDDYNRLEYPRGIVVNGGIHAHKLNYPKRKDVTYLLGTEYMPLRKPFWDVPKKEIREKVESVLITFGGDDVRNLTPKVLSMLRENFPQLNKRVVIGRGFRNIEEIKACADGNTELIFYPDAEEIKNLMLESDIAISAGGQTLYELARVGVPTVAVAVAENQLESVFGLNEAGVVKYAGKWQEKRLFNQLKEFINFMMNIDVRKKLHLQAKKLVDGKGSLNIVSYLLRCV